MLVKICVWAREWMCRFVVAYCNHSNYNHAIMGFSWKNSLKMPYSLYGCFLSVKTCYSTYFYKGKTNHILSFPRNDEVILCVQCPSLIMDSYYLLLPLITSYYLFGIFKLFFQEKKLFSWIFRPIVSNNISNKNIRYSVHATYLE
jgi:phosphatidylserine synthase